MTLAEWGTLILAVLKFPGTILKFVNLLKDTPAEKHEDLVKAMQAEADRLKAGGRPTW